MFRGCLIPLVRRLCGIRHRCLRSTRGFPTTGTQFLARPEDLFIQGHLRRGRPEPSKSVAREAAGDKISSGDDVFRWVRTRAALLNSRRMEAQTSQEIVSPNPNVAGGSQAVAHKCGLQIDALAAARGPAATSISGFCLSRTPRLSTATE